MIGVRKDFLGFVSEGGNGRNGAASAIIEPTSASSDANPGLPAICQMTSLPERSTVEKSRTIPTCVCERETGRSRRTQVRVHFHHDSRQNFETAGRAHGAIAALSSDDKICLAPSVLLARAGSSRAEFRMNVNSEAT